MSIICENLLSTLIQSIATSGLNVASADSHTFTATPKPGTVDTEARVSLVSYNWPLQHPEQPLISLLRSNHALPIFWLQLKPKTGSEIAAVSLLRTALIGFGLELGRMSSWTCCRWQQFLDHGRGSRISFVQQYFFF